MTEKTGFGRFSPKKLVLVDKLDLCSKPSQRSFCFFLVPRGVQPGTSKPYTTHVNSVLSISEWMHEANGAGYSQGEFASRRGLRSRHPLPSVASSSAAHVGAADGATRITPNAMCIPQTQQAQGMEGRRALEGGPQPTRARAVRRSPAGGAPNFLQTPSTRAVGFNTPARLVRDLGGGGDELQPLGPSADVPLHP